MHSWPDLTLPPINLHNMPNTSQDPVSYPGPVTLSSTAYKMLQGFIKGSLSAVPESEWGKGYKEAFKNIQILLSELENIK